MAMLPSALAVLSLINTAPLAGCTLSLGKKKKKKPGFLLPFFFNVCVLWSCLGITYEK